MKAIWDEVVRAFRLTFVDGLAAMRAGARSHPGWWADPHLRKGWLSAAPVFVILMAMVGLLFGRAIMRNVWLFYAYGLPAALVTNVFWFAVAARSRAKAEGR